MKGCENCYWADDCRDVGKRCEYYDPIFGSESRSLREYKDDLKNREEEYRKLVSEQQDDII